jgi:ABC-type transport system involved in cytochrome c biogenesis ATPase subunit
LKLGTGIYTPTRGTVEVHGRISALLELGAGFHPDFSGRENIFVNGIILGMSRREIRTRLEEIIEFSELADFIDEPVRTYSSGMYARLAFAVATHVDPEILLIDEILSVGDEHFGRKSAAKMEEFRKAGKTILLVTHDRARSSAGAIRRRGWTPACSRPRGTRWTWWPPTGRRWRSPRSWRWSSTWPARRTRCSRAPDLRRSPADAGGASRRS